VVKVIFLDLLVIYKREVSIFDEGFSIEDRRGSLVNEKIG